MTTILERPPGARIRWSDRLPAWTVPAAAVVAVLGRLPFIGRALSPDEAGYLLVGGQWDGPGSSLYGNYWVDRPPLLVSIFRLAAFLGGSPALRIMGCLAVALIVVGAARAAQLMGGHQAARWTAIIAAALCLSPVLGVFAVNGELLAAPFVVGGIIAIIRAVQTADRRTCMTAAATAGAWWVCAVMVKQNFVDVAVFAVLSMLVMAARRQITRHRFVDLGAAFGAGALATVVLLAGWTVAHGTSLRGVFDAMYPFRVEAGHVIAAAGSVHATARLNGLLGVAALSGILLLVVAIFADSLRVRRREALSWAVLGLVVFAAASVLLGGSYWHHYLIGLIVPVSIAAGLVSATGHRLVRPIVVLTVASTVIAWAGALALDQGSPGQTAGTAIGSASRPGDTLVSLYGHADVVHASGLSSPYEHLWSLPIKTLDPRLTALDAVLSGPDAPTWIATGPSVRSWGLDTRDARATIARDYRPVTTICDRTVYLRAGLVRALPEAPLTCEGSTTALTQIKDLLP